ncbi:LacI family DNA-binding transcriptional regulator [Bacillus sp. Marseille-P3661]|uniref:LacI family DNA-binding transcriptional regulator n=1 Tax=Bacillus sp. Marseille-P3661 TaxID=1936234 RepID=UPI000C81C6C7|nr:LacI family DNA-binding transcriptional regulator [Bacillus sp. Marseille-P3661]
MASIKDIAQKSGVSVTTVSRVIRNNGYVSEETKKKVLQAIEELDYQPSGIARSLVTKQSNIIGLLIPHIDSPFFSGFSIGVEKVARELGYNVLLCHTQEDTQMEEDSLRVLLERRVDGIIVTPVGKTFKHFKKIVENVPCVLAGRTYEGLNVSNVEVDNVQGSRRVMNHLIELGHRKIGIINGSLFLSTGKKRWEGVQQALIENQIELPSEYIKEGEFTIRSGYAMAKELISMDDRPTAIFAANHMTALGVMRALADLKLKIPQDVALASFEGFEDSEFDFIIQPKITANIHPTAELAQHAVEILHKQITNKLNGMSSSSATDLVIKMKFQERESTVGEKG